MTKSEKKVKGILERAGFTVLRDGWPDFCVFQETPDGIAAFFVEVKTRDYKLNPGQVDLHNVLLKMGIPVYTVKGDELWKFEAKSDYNPTIFPTLPSANETCGPVRRHEDQPSGVSFEARPGRSPMGESKPLPIGGVHC